MNVYRSSDTSWFVLIALPSKLRALATGIGRPDVLSDARFAGPANLAANSAALTAILDETFASRPMGYWQKILDQAYITYGIVREPLGVVDDPSSGRTASSCRSKARAGSSIGRSAAR